MEHIKAVIFDLDNTLLDRTTTFRRFAERFMKHYFSHIESADLDLLLERLIVLDEDGYKNKPVLFAELLNEFPWNKERNKPLVDDLMEYYAENYVISAVLMEQAEEVITHAKGKYKMGIITNGRNAVQYGKIDHLGIRDHFDVILVSEEAGSKKPDPRIFQLAMERLNVRPEECLFVGDHPINDVEGAYILGMHTIWMKVNQPWSENNTAKPLHTIHQIQELLSIM
ncbi:HAD family hydrolase [Paenibacillus sp. Marseille-Q4541]|uniref:HAD family hydrolase n=1 Tax=Paenibacillus sp. Marseille-Q4541 TaxID=2831522 RepID=UPI001BA9B122|nr:HAD family hydrolase [Paenibacillus sp. Marseille-Q4541]